MQADHSLCYPSPGPLQNEGFAAAPFFRQNQARNRDIVEMRPHAPGFFAYKTWPLAQNRRQMLKLFVVPGYATEISDKCVRKSPFVPFHNVMRSNCYLAQKDDNGKITMTVFRYQNVFFKNVIISGIKGTNAYEQKKMLVASIPFYRNLTGYCGETIDHLKLTCCLHYKTDPLNTANMTLGDLWIVICHYIKEGTATFENDGYYDTLVQLAADVLRDPDDISLENKLILSIAARLRAEKYLKQVIISNTGACEDSDRYQMREWFEKAKPFLTSEVITVMDQVNLITPETIHLNAFMYEPLIDISIWTLKDVYQRICALETTGDM